MSETRKARVLVKGWKGKGGMNGAFIRSTWFIDPGEEKGSN